MKATLLVGKDYFFCGRIFNLGVPTPVESAVGLALRDKHADGVPYFSVATEGEELALVMGAELDDDADTNTNNTQDDKDLDDQDHPTTNSDLGGASLEGADTKALEVKAPEVKKGSKTFKVGGAPTQPDDIVEV